MAACLGNLGCLYISLHGLPLNLGSDSLGTLRLVDPRTVLLALDVSESFDWGFRSRVLPFGNTVTFLARFLLSTGKRQRRSARRLFMVRFLGAAFVSRLALAA